MWGLVAAAAPACMHTLGLANTTTKEIAQAAGLSEAALYKHFDDKTELFLCVFRERLPELFATLRDLPNRVGRRTVRANLEELARYQEYMRRSGEHPHRARDLLAAYLRAEQRAGRVAPQASAEGDEHFVKDIVRLLMRALAPTRPVAGRPKS